MSLPSKFITIKAFSEEDSEKRTERMLASGYKLIAGPTKRFDGFGKNIYYLKFENMLPGGRT